MKATILGRWVMELPAPGIHPWFVDWVLKSPTQAGNHLACSYKTFESLKDVYTPGTIDSVLEYFGGAGCQALMLQELFQPGVHVVGDYAPEAVEHMKRALPENVVVRQGDAYDPANDDTAGLVVLDIGNSTVWKAQPHKEIGQLLTRVFAHEPLAVTISDIAAARLHLMKQSYEPILGEGACSSYPEYIRRFGEHINERYGYVMHQANYTRWSCIMSFIPESLATKESGAINKLPLETVGLVLGDKPVPLVAPPLNEHRPRRIRRKKNVLQSFSTERMQQYLAFVEERHQVWEKRQAGMPQHWTDDPILRDRKFTNVFRILDPGSQFVLTDLDDGVDQETLLMRLFLYRHTGRVDAWRQLRNVMGQYPLLGDLDEVLQIWKDYREMGHPVFTGAYLVYPQSATPGTDKLDSILELTKRLFTPGSPQELAGDFLRATTQEGRFATLKRNRGVADFMSMQILTDWGYTRYSSDIENDFVVPGPGCRKGIMAITNTPAQVDFLKFARAEVLMGDNVPMLSLPGGETRVPSIMDVQNTLCEFSKYTRYLSKGGAVKPYFPAHPGVQPEPVLPAHWVNNETTIGTSK